MNSLRPKKRFFSLATIFHLTILVWKKKGGEKSWKCPFLLNAIGSVVVTGYELFLQGELKSHKNLSSISIVWNSLIDWLYLRKAVRQLDKISYLNINCIQNLLKKCFSKIIISWVLMKNLLGAIKRFFLGCFEKHFKQKLVFTFHSMVNKRGFYF